MIKPIEQRIVDASQRFGLGWHTQSSRRDPARFAANPVDEL
jgi:hypothetical protein